MEYVRAHFGPQKRPPPYEPLWVVEQYSHCLITLLLLLDAGVAVKRRRALLALLGVVADDCALSDVSWGAVAGVTACLRFRPLLLLVLLLLACDAVEGDKRSLAAVGVDAACKRESNDFLRELLLRDLEFEARLFARSL